MVTLCRELLTSNLSAREDFPIAAFISLANASDAEVMRGRNEFPDEVIECLRGAVKVCPPGPNKVLVLPLKLVEQLRGRFVITHSLDDYQEATALLEKILDPRQPGGRPDSICGPASALAAQLAAARATFFFGNPEYAEVAISRLRATLSSSISEGVRVQFTEALSMHARVRFEDYSLPESLEEANSNISQLVLLSSESSQSPETSGMLTVSESVRKTYSTTAMQQKIQNLEELLSNTPPGTEGYQECLTDLGRWYESKFHRTKDTSDIKESLKYRRLSLDAAHAHDLRRTNLLISLTHILFLAFEETREITYLNESIGVQYDILKLKSAQPNHFLMTQRLVDLLLTREKMLGQREDRHEAIRLISVSVNYQSASEPSRFRLSCQWAILARGIRHPTTLNAYKTAMSLMQKSLFFAPTVSVQHARLVAMGEHCQKMPLDYAYYQINLGQFEEASEILEQGRALLWSQMRGLRTPVTQLVEDSPLAKRLVKINQELEVTTKSVTPSGRPEIEDDGAQDVSDPFGRLVIKWKKLVEERDALISQIQSQPGSEGFMRAPSFTTLRSAASH
jgi:tetratricopeptide (TPR) repeat protein